MTERKNYILYYIQQIVVCCASILLTGSVFQIYLLESGFTQETVSIYVSIMQGIQVLAMILLAKIIESLHNIFNLTAVTYFVQVLLFVVMLYFSIKHNEPIQQKYLVIFIVSFFVSIYQGINSILVYKIPFFIIDMKEYGKVSGFSGVLVGIVGVLFSGALSYVLSLYPYFHVMGIFSGIGIILTTLAGITLKRFKIKQLEQQNSSEKINLFGYKPFYQLIIPNLCRGISNGIFVLAATIGYSQNILNSVGTGLMVTLSQIATIIGCFLYSILTSRIKDGTLIAVSGIIFCALLPFSLVGNTQNVFLMIYSIAYLLYVCVNYAIPVIIARKIDYRCIGQYSAWRIAIHFGGTAIGNALVSPLVNHVGSTGTLIFCGVLMLVCGICYYKFEKSNS